MADRFKILAQVLPTATGSDTTAYTVPVAAATTVGTVAVSPKSLFEIPQVLVTSIIVCNTDSSDRTFQIRLKTAAAEGDDDKEMLFYDTAIATKATQVLSLGLVLESGNVIKVRPSVASKLAFTIMGIEVT